jgi:predicted nucleic acid-binding protein
MFLDTSGLFRLFHIAERGHADARTLFESAPWTLTHSYVLAEFVALANARSANRRNTLAFADSLSGIANLRIIWVDDLIHEDGMRLLRGQLDKTYSLCDAVSFILMRKAGVTDALTTDHHFEQAGFVRLLRPS